MLILHMDSQTMNLKQELFIIEPSTTQVKPNLTPYILNQPKTWLNLQHASNPKCMKIMP